LTPRRDGGALRAVLMLTKTQVERLRRLQDERRRRDEGVFVVEGEKAVREFEGREGYELEIYATSEWGGWCRQAGLGTARLIATPPEQMQRISHLPSPSVVLAVVRPPERVLDATELRRGLTLALDTVQDPGNVGTIVRTADWYGVDRVLLSSGCAEVFAQKVVNAAKGSLARVPVHRVDLSAVLAEVAREVPVWACDLEGVSVHGIEPRLPAILVIGSEGRGLSPEVRAWVRHRVTIPAFGAAESLNAAIAAAVVLDNWCRRRARPETLGAARSVRTP
jgi:TrmH family RNA methyltransferase